ncbi:MAG: carbohydrate kinase family protein [Candidatus Hydrogenedentes bacterium]|nr:carbohydrate kinase family protein [Candidatus Hydrogenedentota bacterium]
MSFELVTLGVVCADIMARPVSEIPKRGTLGHIPHLEMHLGGLAGVTAIVYSQLGGTSAFLGRLGCDSFGDYLLNTMRAAGVNVDGIERTNEVNSSATMVMIHPDGERTFLHHMGTNAETTPDHYDMTMLEQARMVHWGGPGITTKLEGAPMARLFERLRKKGIITSFDTCYDGSGRWLPLIEPALPHTNVAITSLEEARLYTGKQDAEDITAFLKSYGPEIAIVKLGAQGMYIDGPGEKLYVPSYEVNVLDTTGAGDAACAGFIYGYLRGWPLLRCGQLACAVGALTVEHMGGAEAIQSLDATLAFMEQGRCLIHS